jgi:hypothetical protein
VGLNPFATNQRLTSSIAADTIHGSGSEREIHGSGSEREIHVSVHQAAFSAA